MSKKGTYTLEEFLAMTNEELKSNWTKLTGLIRLYTGDDWGTSKERAILLLDEGNADEYIEAIRAGASPSEVTVINPQRQQKKEKPAVEPPKKTIYEENYERILQFAPGIEERLLNGEYIYGKSRQSGYNDLNLELTDSDSSGYYLALSHTYIVNGDLVPDPDMVVLFNIKNRTVEALTFQNLYYYSTVYDDLYYRKRVDPKEKKAQNAFLTQWLKNIIDQEHEIIWREEVEEEVEEEDEESKTTPDISSMDENVISPIRETFKGGILDDHIQLYLKDKNGEIKLGALAKFFLAERINAAPLGVHVDYPTQEEINADYQRLLELSEKEDAIDASIEENMKKTTEMKELEETIKYWPKLAAFIRTHENLEPEEAKEKALQLKREGNAEEYLLNISDKDSKSKLGNLMKANYQAFLRLLPELPDRINDAEMGVQVGVQDESLSYRIEKGTNTRNGARTLAIHEVAHGKQGTLLIVFQSKGKKIWVDVHADRLLDFADFSKDAEHSATNEYKVNQKFGKWLNSLLDKKRTYYWASKIAFDAQAHKEEIEKRQLELERQLENYPIVMEWTEGSPEENLGFNSLEELRKKLKEYATPPKKRGYTETRITFRGFGSDRIDLGESEGGYNPHKEPLYDYLSRWYPSFDWSVFLETKPEPHKKPKLETKSEVINQFTDLEVLKEEAKKIPDFEPGKVQLTEMHIRAGITQKDIDWINKHKQGLILTPRSKPMIPNTKHIESDIQLQAKQPGKRISRTGKIYYEGRSNRSDRTKYGF